MFGTLDEQCIDTRRLLSVNIVETTNGLELSQEARRLLHFASASPA
ncbi:MAG TPA: hypothetical protein VNU71_01985 [Burkholderiaceae bacterium]|nr:hypothetical protein [Burkholderiaceae bacterium]